MDNTEDNVLLLLGKANISTLNKDELSMIQHWKTLSKENSYLAETIFYVAEHGNLLKNYKKYDSFDVNERNSWGIGGKVLLIVAFLLLMVSIMWSWSSMKTLQNVVFLPDESEIHLSENSQYVLNDFFGENKREMILVGSAFFDITHSEKPFVISHDFGEIQVLGTSFFVDQNNDRSIISVRDGKVVVRGNFNDEICLEKGETAIVTDSSVRIIAYRMNYPKLLNANYNDANLIQIFEDLSLLFNIKFQFPNNINRSKCKFNGMFEDATIIEVLEELKVVFGMTYSMELNEITIFDLNCF